MSRNRERSLSTQRPVYIGLGSNLDRPDRQLSAAVQALQARPDAFAGLRVSRRTWTEPVGGVPQPEYLNAVVGARTTWTPHDLLALLQGIEARLGRERSREERWGPRPIDLDLLMVGDLVVESQTLTLPHPEMTRRRFVLEPLAELAPQAVHPTTGQTVLALLEGLSE